MLNVVYSWYFLTNQQSYGFSYILGIMIDFFELHNFFLFSGTTNIYLSWYMSLFLYFGDNKTCIGVGTVIWLNSWHTNRHCEASLKSLKTVFYVLLPNITISTELCIPIDPSLHLHFDYDQYELLLG